MAATSRQARRIISLLEDIHSHLGLTPEEEDSIVEDSEPDDEED